MKSLSKLILVNIACLFIFTSCKKEMSSDLTGKWKLSEAKIQMVEELYEMADMRQKELRDSIGATSDTTLTKRYTDEISEIQAYVDNYRAQQDSSLSNTFWTLKKDSTIETTQRGKTHTGKWWVNENTMHLYTKSDMGTDSIPFTLEGDTLTIEFDSISYMKFEKVKEK